MSDSIEVEEGTQEDYLKSNKRNYDLTGQRIKRGITWSVGLILFLVTLIYAGIRGNYAYNHDPVIQTTSVERDTIAFPAVTVCPVWPAQIKALECQKEVIFAVVSTCLNTAYFRNFTIEGYTHSCLTFNDPIDSTQILTSSGSDHEFAIQVFVNPADIIPGEPVGALVMVHSQGVEPEVEADQSFMANVGEVTEAWLELYETTLIDGSRGPDDHKTVTSASNRKENITGETASIVDIDFIYVEQIVYQNKQYYTYVPDNWIGEVGGLACLLWFLHWAFCSIVLFIVSKIRGSEYRGI